MWVVVDGGGGREGNQDEAAIESCVEARRLTCWLSTPFEVPP